jgi:Glu-tRNA(Gln) amidotransferase subunit E-like FAD-binding protein
MIMPIPPIKINEELMEKKDSKTTPTMTVIMEQLSNTFTINGLVLKMIFKTMHNEIHVKKRSI